MGFTFKCQKCDATIKEITATNKIYYNAMSDLKDFILQIKKGKIFCPKCGRKLSKDVLPFQNVEVEPL